MGRRGLGYLDAGGDEAEARGGARTRRSLIRQEAFASDLAQLLASGSGVVGLWKPSAPAQHSAETAVLDSGQNCRSGPRTAVPWDERGS
jgi:hypothetical protein